jgi:ppGpp synthetase/RelA/SpoT-type nucleotidyltranferase
MRSRAFDFSTEAHTCMAELAWWGEMTKVKREYGPGRIDKAGKILICDGASESEITEAHTIMNNWRFAHSYPLEVALASFRQSAVEVYPRVIIAERLKRLPSIAAKLRREKNMKLSQMQDIGGCRAVFRTIEDVRQVMADTALLKNCTGPDYIRRPKISGYRSIHLIWRFRSEDPSDQEYDGMRVEIQVRTALQHAWATAVEIASTYTNADIKSGEGDQRWIRFFSLMGTAFANIEGCPPVPDTPTNKRELLRELRKLTDDLRVREAMKNWSEITTIRKETETTVSANTFLVTLRLADYLRWQLKIVPFSASRNASEEYMNAEKEIAGKHRMQVVLVSVGSIDNLREAYPNYYADTTEFIKVLEQLI